MNVRLAAVLMVLALAPGAALAGEASRGINLGGQEMSVIVQAMGNSDIVLVRTGLSEPNNVASWGLTVAHKPETSSAAQSTSFGLWGMLSTEIEVLPPGTLGLWSGLTAKPFVDVDVMYDIDQSRAQVWPGVGVRLAPTNTLALTARLIYPLGDNALPSAMDLNEFTGLFGLEITF